MSQKSLRFTAPSRAEDESVALAHPWAEAAVDLQLGRVAARTPPRRLSALGVEMDELKSVLKRQVRELACCVLSQPECPALDRSAEANASVGLSQSSNICTHGAAADVTSLKRAGNVARSIIGFSTSARRSRLPMRCFMKALRAVLVALPAAALVLRRRNGLVRSAPCTIFSVPRRACRVEDRLPRASATDCFDAYVMNNDGSGQQRLTAKPNVFFPVRSPDAAKGRLRERRSATGSGNCRPLRHEHRRERNADADARPGERRRASLVAGTGGRSPS